jgi:dTDP-4-dehydrorhamnose reductase
MKICILGSTGMLGNATAKHFLNSGCEVVLTHRNEKVKLSENSVYFDAENTDLSFLNDCDYVLNCIGTIKPFMDKNPITSIYINSIFPRRLANHCEQNDAKLIHITTDCVYSGRDGNYREDSLHDCLDNYGKSKSLGEPENCMVIRTSIIGEEIHKNASLIAWAKSMKGKEANGFKNHRWNGITTNHYAEICQNIIDNSLYEVGLFHVYSNVINKHQLLNLINDKFNLKIKINEVTTDTSVDRTLTSNKHLVKKLHVKSIEQQIKEL